MSNKLNVTDDKRAFSEPSSTAELCDPANPQFQAVLARARLLAGRAPIVTPPLTTPDPHPPRPRTGVSESTERAIAIFTDFLERQPHVSFLIDPGFLLPCYISPTWAAALQLFNNCRGLFPDDLSDLRMRRVDIQLTSERREMLRSQIRSRIESLKALPGACFGIIWHIEGDIRSQFDCGGQSELEAFDGLRASFASELHDEIVFG